MKNAKSSRRWMKRLLRASVCGLAVGVIGNAALGQMLVPSTLPSTNAEASTPVAAKVAYLNSARFKIPFNVAAGRTDLSQVQLWVSTDAGKNWQMHGTATPDQRWFSFRAAAEGDYYFSVQTVDRSGQTFPSQSPPMQVRVDTSKPEAAIQADINSLGQVVIDIRVLDDQIDKTSAVIKVRTDRDPNWQAISVEQLELANGLYRKQLIVNLPECREVAFVFSVKDLAKNTGETSLRYRMPRTAAGEQGMTLASTPTGLSQRITSSPPPLPQRQPRQGSPLAVGNFPTQPIEGRPATASSLAGSEAATNVGKSPLGQQHAELSRSTNPPNEVSSHSRIPAIAGAKSWQVPGQGQASYTGSAHSLPHVAVPNSAGPGTLASNGGLSLESGRAINHPAAPGLEELPAPAPNPESSGFPANPGLNQGFPSPASPSATQYINRSLPQAEQAAPGYSLPKRQETAKEYSAEIKEVSPVIDEFSNLGAYHCKAASFSLDYSIEALGGGKLSEIELWGTEDGGRTWQQWGTDPDRQSPFDVQVGNDGLFGFRMVVVGNNGLVSNRPKAGDIADVWINVDTTVPKARITRAVYGEGPEDGMLVIDYDGDDGHLVLKPITLSYSERAEGPWITIATGLSNTGVYLWKPKPGLPEMIYLKLEAVDRAGNIGVHQLDVPIATRGLAPRGRIHGIRPIAKP
ncbi:MAG: hypothetical protein VXZ82_18370 [Planctomycetota bacterium]|nr:hypothetical protein [Planctomycetota bacterium]